MEYFGTTATGQDKISNDDFWGCLKTKDNLLWISTTFGTADNNRALYKVSTISTDIKYSRTNNRITKFVEDAGGDMWFGSRWLMRKNKDGG